MTAETTFSARLEGMLTKTYADADILAAAHPLCDLDNR